MVLSRKRTWICYKCCILGHIGKRNYLIADGHVESTYPLGKEFVLARSNLAGGPYMGRDNHGGFKEYY